MESIPASTLVPQPSSLNGALGEASKLTAEAGDAPSPLSFAGILQALFMREPRPESSLANGQTMRQDGQMLSGTSGNSWPLLLPDARSQDAMPGPVSKLSAEEQNPLLQNSNKTVHLAADELFSAAGRTLLSAKPLMEGAGKAREAENGLLLMTSTGDEAPLSLAGVATKAADLATPSVLPSATTPMPSAEMPTSLEAQRFGISPRLDAPQWEDAFAGRLVWMAKEKHQVVELRLNPPELGVVNVRMALHQNDANIAIGVHNSAVREAIEASLPRLRDLLAESGVSLMNVDVSSSHEFSSDGRQSAAGHDGYEGFYGALASADNDPFSQGGAGLGTFQRISKGIVDHYA